MTSINLQQALTEALTEEMRRDPRVLMFGEGVATKNPQMFEEFGAKRIRNTPLAEGIIAGTAAGAAATGLRPVIDLLFAPFLTFAMDEIVNSAGKLRFISGGQFSFPMVTMIRTGAGWAVGAQHNHNNEAWFVHTPGIKVVMPSNAADAKGLMKAAIRDENPVMFFTDIGLMFVPSEVPEGDHVVEIGKANVLQQGSDVTLISYGKTVHQCVAAASALIEAGISAEVIDLRSLKPLDDATILASVRKTGRAVIAHEAAAPCSVSSEVSAILAERAFSSLKSPIVRLTGPDAPAAASFPLEAAYAPNADSIVRTVYSLVKS